MSESNEDTTADEQTVAELKERIGELEERVEQQENQGPSRRQFLGSLTGIASAGAAGYYLGTQRASAAASWGSASGQMGTQSTPLQQLIAQTGTFQSVSTDDLNIANVGTSIYATSDQTISNATETQVAFDIAEFDHGNVTFDAANNKVTIDTAGLYLLSGKGYFAADGDYRLQAALLVNGNNVEVDRTTGGASGVNNSPHAIRTLPLSANDEIILEVEQKSGGNLTLVSGEQFTRLEVLRLG